MLRTELGRWEVIATESASGWELSSHPEADMGPGSPNNQVGHSQAADSILEALTSHCFASQMRVLRPRGHGEKVTPWRGE